MKCPRSSSYRIALLGAAALLVASASLTAEVALELDTELVMAYGAKHDNMDQADLLLRPKLSTSLGEHTEAVLSGRLRWATTRDLDSSERRLETYANASRPWQQQRLSLELRDAYVERDIGALRARVGKQQIVWGALDGIKLLDAINPQDFREFILDDFDESRISQWAMHLEWPLAGGYLELAVVPDTSVHELPGPQAKFAFQAKRFRFGFDANNGSNTALQTKTRRPGNALADGTYGLRYSRFTAGWDLAASVVTGNDHQPVGMFVEQPGIGTVLEQQYRSRTIVGVAATKSFGAIALRTEIAVRPNRAFNRRSDLPQSLEVVRRDQLSMALAMDWQAPLDLFVNLQLLHEQIRDHDNGFAAPKKDTLATALVRRSFRYDSLTTELRWYGNLADGDGLVRPSIAYQMGDNTSIRLGADLFYGTRDGLFGQFDRADQMTLTLQRVF